MLDKPVELTSFYGEVTKLSGVPNKSCVAYVVYHSHPASFAATVIASAQELHFISTSSKAGTVTRKLWRPSDYVHSGKTDYHHHVSDCGSSTRIFSLTAFLLHPQSSEHEDRRVESSQYPPDTVCILFAWEDAKRTQHITLLMVSLLAAFNLAGEGSSVFLSQREVFVMSPRRCLLCFIHHPSFSSSTSSISNHVVVLSTYATREKDVPVPSMEGSFIYLTILETAEEADCTHLSNLVVLPPVVGASPSVSRRVVVGEVGAESIAGWIGSFQVKKVVSSFDLAPNVCDNTSDAPLHSLRGAAGTTDGRVYLLCEGSHRIIRRVSGPVVGLKFVTPLGSGGCSTHPSRDCCCRIASIDHLLERKRANYSSAAAFCDVSLIILDAIGRILIIRRVNSNSSVVQIVNDIPRIITDLGCDGNLEVDTAVSHVRGENPVGGVLSSGLLDITVRHDPLELIVSTKERAIVTIPFHRAQDTFAISSSILNPIPVLFMGVVDYTMEGREDLLMAGPEGVLLERQASSTVKDQHRISILLKLLNSALDHRLEQ